MEKDRRNPFDMEKLTQLAKILELSNEERELMFNLAGKKQDKLRNAINIESPDPSQDNSAQMNQYQSPVGFPKHPA